MRGETKMKYWEVRGLLAENDIEVIVRHSDNLHEIQTVKSNIIYVFDEEYNFIYKIFL